MFSEGNDAHPVGYDSPLQIVMALVLAHFSFNYNLMGRAWHPAADYNGNLAGFKLKKRICAEWPLLSAAGFQTGPDHSAE
jgi:hypothetical protein